MGVNDFRFTNYRSFRLSSTINMNQSFGLKLMDTDYLIGSYALTFLRSYALTFLRSYVLTFLRSYVLTFLRSYVLTFLRSYAYPGISSPTATLISISPNLSGPPD